MATNGDNSQAPPVPPPISHHMSGYLGPTSSYGVDPYASPFGSSSFMQPAFGNPYGMGYNNYNNYSGGMYGM
jgi:hypothetical protein